MSVQKPIPVEVQDFKFILRSKIKVFQNCEIQCNKPYLLCAASRFGLVFSAYQTHIKVIQLLSLIECGPKQERVPLRTQELPGYITHIAVNCDHTILSIALNFNGSCIMQFYDVTSYYKQTIALLNEVRLTSNLIQISWNPCITNIVAAVLEGGSLLCCELNENSININTTENDVQALSLSWSPKGKQIVVGTKSCTLCQYKPDLKLVKSIPVPDMKGFITSVQWLSNYQFVATFYDLSNPESLPCVAIVNAPKTGQVYSLNYEQVCYNSRECAPKLINYIHQQTWSVLLIFSLNSSEIGVLAGLPTQDVCNWQQWFMVDDARAEIPLIGKDESYIAGVALDTGTTNELILEDKTYPPMPILHLLSDRGFLISFDVVNLKPDVPSICCPPEPVRDSSGLSLYILESSAESPVQEIKKAIIPPKNEVLINSAISNQAQPISKANMTMHSSGDFSFMINQPPITSTPTKHQDTFYQESKDKQSLLFTKPVLIKDPEFIPNSQTTTMLTKPAIPLNNVPNISITPLNQVKNDIKPSKPTALQPSAKEVGTPTRDTIKDFVEEIDKNEGCILNPDCELDKEAVLLLLQSETNMFYKDLQDILKLSNKIEKNEEDHELKLLDCRIVDLETFIAEAKESTENLEEEVKTLNEALMEAFCWVNSADNRDDTKSACDKKLFPNLYIVDALSTHQLSSISKMLYYVESQITQLGKQIDANWSEFQDRCKEKIKGKMHIPSLEILYQTLLKQGDILSKQKQIVQDNLKRFEKPSVVENISTDEVSNLSNMLEIIHLSIIEEFDKDLIEKVIARESLFTKEKHDVLWNILKKHESNKIEPFKVNQNFAKHSVFSNKINNMSETNMQPVSSSNKTNSFQAQMNEYIEKQSLLNKNQPAATISQYDEKLIQSNKQTSLPVTEKISDSTYVISFENNSKESTVVIPNSKSLMDYGIAQVSTSAFNTPNKAETFNEFGLQKPERAFPFNAQRSVATSIKTEDTVKETPKPFSFNIISSKDSENSNTVSKIEKDAAITPISASAKNVFTSSNPFSKPDENQVPPAADNAKASITSFSFALNPGSTTKTATTTDIVKDLRICSPTSFSNNDNKANVTANTFGFGTNTFTFGSAAIGVKTTSVNDVVKAKPLSSTATSLVTKNVPTQEPFIKETITTDESSKIIHNTKSLITSTANMPMISMSNNITKTITSPSIFGGTTETNNTSSTITTATTAAAIFSSVSSNKPNEDITEKPIASIFGSNSSMLESSYITLNSLTPTISIPTINTTANSSPAVSITPIKYPSENSAAVSTTTATSAITTSSFTEVVAPTSANNTEATFSSVTSTTIIAKSTKPDTSTTLTSLFGGNSTKNSTPSIFGEASVTTLSTASLFGSSIAASAKTTSTTSSFDTNIITTTVTSSTVSSTNIASSFFSGISITTSGNSVFGGGIPSTSTTSLFGGEATTATTTSSLTSMFGGSLSLTSGTSKSIFGSGTTTASSVFGGSITSNTSNPLFGSATSNNTSIFVNNSPMTASSNSVFGGAATSPAASTPMFSSSSFSSSTQGSSIFGGIANKSSGSIFGSGNSPLKPATGMFGQQSTFGSSSGVSGSIFGGNNSQNNSAFGTPTTQSAFGSFGATSGGFGPSMFGGGAFSGGSGGASVAQGGFGSPLAMNKPATGGFASPPTFGSPPSFGAPPSFGSPPCFGATPAFGSAPAFGSPTNTFSNPPTQSAFSSQTQQSTTFENLASSNVISFGNLAQNSPPQVNKPALFSGSSSFSSWR